MFRTVMKNEHTRPQKKVPSGHRVPLFRVASLLLLAVPYDSLTLVDPPHPVSATFKQQEVDDGANSSGQALSVTWPLDNTAYSGSTVERNVIGTNYVAASLNHSVRVIIAGSSLRCM